MSQGFKEVNGFNFTEEEAVIAEKELSAIKYIDSQIKSGDEKKLLNLYCSLIQQRFFKTQVGIDYLRTLQKYLLSSSSFDDSKIPPIPAPVLNTVLKMDEPEISRKSKKANEKKTVKEKRGEDASELQLQMKKYKSYFHYAAIICIVFLLTIGGMFYILSTTDSPTIINYENKIIDKYSSWEEELNKRELDINERERALETTNTNTGD